MLFRREVLDGIAAGRVTLAFRRWRRPTVRAGGRLRTPVGELAIEAVDPVDPASITDEEARRAGHADARAVRSELDRRAAGIVYRVAFRLAGADARVALRADDRLSREELETVLAALARLDRRASDGAWTRHTLKGIADDPGRRAADLAATAGVEETVFKRRVRRLKELGLTESLSVGYRLSPRGRRVLAHLPDDGEWAAGPADRTRRPEREAQRKDPAAGRGAGSFRRRGRSLRTGRRDQA